MSHNTCNPFTVIYFDSGYKSRCYSPRRFMIQCYIYKCLCVLCLQENVHMFTCNKNKRPHVSQILSVLSTATRQLVFNILTCPTNNEKLIGRMQATTHYFSQTLPTCGPKWLPEGCAEAWVFLSRQPTDVGAEYFDVDSTLIIQCFLVAIVIIFSYVKEHLFPKCCDGAI